MSATLDGARVARLMGDAPLVVSEGRAFPVETRYVGRDPRARIEDEVARVALDALAAERGSILVFLPGQSEIMRTAALLEARVRDASVDIAPLYGAMDRAAQDKAVLPAPAGRRKVTLATSIAETSLTIEGVRVVVDSGLSRVPRFEPDIGVTRLETLRVSRAGADQRRGRAGRTEPGVCYRLWEAAADGALAPFARPEILSADLSGFLLDLAAWGVADPAKLAFLDPPPAPALAEARALLTAIGALDRAGRITEEGKAIAALPLPPRLARMVIDAARQGHGDLAGRIAVLLTERGLGGDGVDLGRPPGALCAGPLGARRGGAAARRQARATGAGGGDKRAGRRGRGGGAARLRLSRAHRQGARQARRVSDGQRARRGAGARGFAERRDLSGGRRNRRPRRRRAHPARRSAIGGGGRGRRRRRDRNASTSCSSIAPRRRCARGESAGSAR